MVSENVIKSIGWSNWTRLFKSSVRDQGSARQRPEADRVPVLTPDALLATGARQARLRAIDGLVRLSPAHHQALYQSVIRSYAAYVQQLPASEAHHHAGLGGLLDHGLEVASTALRLRRAHLLPKGAATEVIKRQEEIWSYAAFTASLLHDIAKPAVDHEVVLFDVDGRPLGPWDPWGGPMPATAHGYRMRFVRGRRYRLHERAALLFAHFIVPEAGLRWVASEREVLAAWLATISGDADGAGVLGAIVQQADATSVAADLSGGAAVQIPTARARPLHERLVTALRYLLDNEELALNRPGAAGWLVGEDLWLVVKTVLDKLRAHLYEEGQTDTPSDNRRLMDELQQRGVLIPCGERAVWRATVSVGDWQQSLTMLRFPAAKIWTDPTSRPAACSGTVEPILNDDASGETGPGMPPEVVIENDDSKSEEPLTDVFGGRMDVDTAHQVDRTSPDREDVASLPRSPPSTTESKKHQYTEEACDAEQELGETNAGRCFLDWLREGLATGRLPINIPAARIHRVKEGLLLVSPAVFKDFATAEDVGWIEVQKSFQKLKLHRRTPDHFNVWNYRVEGPRRSAKLKGFVIEEPEKSLALLSELPPPNSHLSLLAN